MRDRYERKHRLTLKGAIRRGYHDTPKEATTVTKDVLVEIANERAAQRMQWGDDFDDANTEQDWAAFIMHYTAIGVTSRLGAVPGRPFREAMLKVATLAVAAIDAHDRKATRLPAEPCGASWAADYGQLPCDRPKGHQGRHRTYGPQGSIEWSVIAPLGSETAARAVEDGAAASGDG